MSKKDAAKRRLYLHVVPAIEDARHIPSEEDLRVAHENVERAVGFPVEHVPSGIWKQINLEDLGDLIVGSGGRAYRATPVRTEATPDVDHPKTQVDPLPLLNDLYEEPPKKSSDFVENFRDISDSYIHTDELESKSWWGIDRLTIIATVVVVIALVALFVLMMFGR